MAVSRTAPPAGKLKVGLQRTLLLGAWAIWQQLDALLPRQACFYVATVIGEVLYWALPGKRAAVLDNMAHVLGPAATRAEVHLVAKRSFRNYAKYLTEFAHLPRWSPSDFEHLMTATTGWHHIDHALGDGKGVIIVTSHFGNWDIGGWYFGQRHAFSAVVEPLELPEIDAIVQGWRKAKRIGIIPLAHAGRGVLRALQQGGLVGLVVDRPTHAEAEGVSVKFFGEWTRVPAGAAHFALRTGAPVVAAGLWRTPANTYASLALPPLRFGAAADGKRYVQRDAGPAVEQAMQRIMEDVETIIRTHPDQWYMFRRMWPRRRNWQPWAAARYPEPQLPVPSLPSTVSRMS